MIEDLPITSTEHLREAIARVSFEKSCLDMGWRWDVDEVLEAQGVTMDDTLVGWCVRCSFQRPDTHTGEVSTGYGREWIVRPGITESAFWKTMFAAAKMVVEHELLEAFKVDGRRPFDPHRSVQDLISIPEARPS
jgi:hypothetical protein